ncbi:MAG: biotin/lipoyl-binding protein, partial [Synergistaceae bacterium]|nr:biotin/lipoyl-binding protein [Synergistaceae bacterium]
MSQPASQVAPASKKKKVVIGAVIAVALAIIAVAAWMVMKPSGPGDGFVSGNGRIEATEIDISAKLGGRVEDIMAKEGDFVKAGQLLAQMQVYVLDAQRDEARAHLQQTITAIASAEAQVAARKSDMAAAQAMVAQSKSELDAAQRRFTRIKSLAAQDAVSI